MDTKAELVNRIKEWIQIDNEITKLQKQIKEYRDGKKQLTSSLVDVMKNNEIDCFDINGGALVYSQRKTKKAISGKYLLLQLEKYYKDQPDVAKDLTQHLLENREENIKKQCMQLKK